MVQRGNTFILVVALLAMAGFAEKSLGQADAGELHRSETDLGEEVSGSKMDASKDSLATAIEKEAYDVQVAAARDRMAVLLSSDEIEHIDFHATMIEVARARIYLAVDTYLDGATEKTDNIDRVERLGMEVVRALNDHEIWYKVRTFLADKGFVIRTDDDARELGELILLTSLIVERITEGEEYRIPVGIVATRIFSGIGYDSEMGITILRQYLLRLRKLSEEPSADLRNFLELDE